MKVIFCLTTARAGTKYINYLFKNNIKDCVSRHEPKPSMFGKPIYWYQIGQTKKIREVFKRKAKKINGYNAKVYIETNHAFLKSFSSVAMEFFPDMKLIHLIRNPLEMAKSGMNRYKQIRKYHFPSTFKGDDGKKYFKWTLTGNEEIYKFFDYDWESIYNQTDNIRIFQFLLLEWIEIENRAIAFLDKFKKHKDCQTLLVPNDLNDINTIRDMFDFFEIELKQEVIQLPRRKNTGAIPTIITDKEKKQLDEIVKNIPVKYLQIFQKKPYIDFEWRNIFSLTSR